MAYLRDLLRDGFGLSLIAMGFILGMLCDAARRIWTSSVPDFEQQPHEKADERFAASADRELRVCTWLTIAIAMVAAAMLLAFSAPAHADEWTGRDKTMHAIGGALVAGTVKEATGSAGLALAAGGIVAVGKELTDMHRPGHTPSHKDALVTFAASVLSVSIQGLRIGPGWIAYRREF